MAFSGSQITRLGLYGGPRAKRAGSFAGKTQAATIVPQADRFTDNLGWVTLTDKLGTESVVDALGWAVDTDKIGT